MKPPRSSLKVPTGMFYGWWIVIVSLLSNTLGHGAFQRSFSIYFLPIQQGLGVSSAKYSTAELLGRFASGVQAPVSGYLTDRLGPGAMMAAGGVILGIGFILLYFTTGYLYFLLVYALLLSLGSRIGFNNAGSTAVTQWFRRKRALAMSLVSTGESLGGVIVTPIVTLMVIGLGWRTSALISGIVILALVVPLSLFIRRPPQSTGPMAERGPAELPPARLGSGQLEEGEDEYGDPGAAKVGRFGRQAYTETDYTLKQAVRTQAYWLLVLAAGMRDCAYSAVRWHLAPLMVWSGVSLRTAGLFIGLISLANLVFNPLVGWLGDKWSKQGITAAGMVAGALAMVVMLYSKGQVWPLALFIVLLAFSETGNFLSWAILGDFFGRKSFATLRGSQNLSGHLMGMGTPWLVGWIFDQTESYFWGLVILIVVYGLAAVVYGTLPSPPFTARFSRPG